MNAPDVPRFQPSHKTAEAFSGTVNGKKASQLEERFARELDIRKISYTFQIRILPNGKISEYKTNLPGEVEIDFLAVWQGLVQPVQIDGEIGHYKMPWQKEIDREKDARVDSVLLPKGAWPIKRISYVDIWTPELTKQKCREVFT
jgi:hypothetical protein